MSKHSFSFSSQNLTFVYSMPDLTRRIHNLVGFERVYYSLSIPVLDNSVKSCSIVWTLFKTFTAVYINKYLTCNIGYRAIYYIQFTPIKWWNNIASVIWNYAFNKCVESCNIVVTCLRELVITIQNVFTAVQYINIYACIITWTYKYFILPYSMNVSFPIKCSYSNIHGYPPHMDHWYAFPITEKIFVW